jgi:hypothetical protein
MASRIVWKAPDRLTPRMASQISGVASARGTVFWIPALLTRMSAPPHSETAPIMASMAATSRMSASRKQVAGAPAASISARAARAVSSSARPCTATRAPADASALAIARPMPCTEPVTSAVFPSRNRSILGLPQPVPQFRLQHLAVIVLGQLLDEDIALGALEAGDRVSGNARRAPFRHAPDGRSDDEGHHLLAPFGLRAPTTATSRTLGWESSASSTSRG